jgi:hypothetical protein
VIAIICHDAGGAEIVSSLVRRRGLNCRYALAGPAIKVFARKLGDIPNDSVGQAIEGAEGLICGTSSPASFELDAIALARRRGIPSVSILDHWINYRDRFEVQGTVRLPDELWVVDVEAEALAASTFPGVPLTRIENPYRLDVLDRLRDLDARTNRAPQATGKTALYVTEPTSEHAQRMHGDRRYWGYTETQALGWFLSALRIVDPDVSRVVVRPHPSERMEKYLFARQLCPVELVIRNDDDLLEEISDADLIAGCNSMAMVVGTWANKRVLCCIPPDGRGYALPDTGVEFAAHDPALTALLASSTIA